MEQALKPYFYCDVIFEPPRGHSLLTRIWCRPRHYNSKGKKGRFLNPNLLWESPKSRKMQGWDPGPVRILQWLVLYTTTTTTTGWGSWQCQPEGCQASVFHNTGIFYIHTYVPHKHYQVFNSDTSELQRKPIKKRGAVVGHAKQMRAWREGGRLFARSATPPKPKLMAWSVQIPPVYHHALVQLSVISDIYTYEYIINSQSAAELPSNHMP